MIPPAYKLYCSYGLLTWGDRLWSFSLGLILIRIGSDLRLAAVNGLLDDLFVLLFAASVGRWIDAAPRLTAAKLLLLVNNSSVVASVVALLFVLTDGFGYVDVSGNDWLRWCLVGASMLLCAVSVLARTGSKIVFARDWIVVLADGQRDKLADMNATFLRIDLTANILSPLIGGQLMTSINVVAGAVFIVGWHVCSLAVEYSMISAVYRAAPALAQKRRRPRDEQHKSSTAVSGSDDDDSPALTDKPLVEQPAVRTGSPVGALRAAVGGWRVYFGQPVLPAALALALLYMTMLNLESSVTTGFAYAQGLQENVLALARGFGALVGIAGSFAFPRLRARIGLPRTGLVALVLQLLCSLLAVASIWLPGSPFDVIGYFSGTSTLNSTINATSSNPTIDQSILTQFWQYSSIWAFISGISLARFGLWVADLSIAQIMQESVAETDRGVVNGVQSALQQLLDMLKNALVVALPDPRTFGLLIIASWLSVFAGFSSFCLYSYRVRGHLLPLHAFVGRYMRGQRRADEAVLPEFDTAAANYGSLMRRGFRSSTTDDFDGPESV